MAKTYVASDRPAFISGSLASAHQKPRYWRTRGPVGDVCHRTGGKITAPLTRAEKIARDRRLGVAY